MITHLTRAARRQFVATSFPGVTSSTIWGENGNGSDFIGFKAGARFPLHDHEGPEEIIMLSGKIRFGDKVVSAGDYLMPGPGDVHDAEALEDSVFFIAHVGGPVLKG
jgi:anti-sigma factor ChrR (cupin superfamily)